jgi:phage-related protein
MSQSKTLTVRFYRTQAGSEPVRDWIKALDMEDRQTVGRELRLVELGWPIGMPLCRALGSGITLERNRIARVLFCAMQGHMVLLHSFIKKTQQTPSAELDLARKRQKEVTPWMEANQ